MLKYIIYTFRLYIHVMFDEMFVMASRGLVKGLLKCFAFASLFPYYLSVLKVSFNYR